MFKGKYKLDHLFCQIVAGSCLGKSSLVDLGLKIKKHHGKGNLQGVSIIPSNATNLTSLFRGWKAEDKTVDSIKTLLDNKDYLYIFLDIDDFPSNVSDFVNMEFMKAYVELLVSNSVLNDLTSHKFRVVALTRVGDTDLKADKVYAFVSDQWLLRQKRFLFRSGKLMSNFDSEVDLQDCLYGMKKGVKVDLGNHFILDYFLNPENFVRETLF